MKKISIIIPVYKVEPYLRQCVDSVLCQTYKNIEVILVDDGSPDNCPIICDEYAKSDSRIKVIHKTNGGLSSARNAGLDIVSGDYVAFIDSDDYWDNENALAECISSCEAQDLDVLLFGYKKYFQKEERYEVIQMNINVKMEDNPQTLKLLMVSNAFVTSAWNKLIKSNLINGMHKIRFRDGQLSEDIEYCAQIILNANTYGVINKYFYVYRQQNYSSISSNIGVKNITDIAEVITRYLKISKGIDAKRANELYNYLSLQYVLWMTISNFVKASAIKDVLKEMKSYWWLIDYDWCPYVKKVKPIKFLGFSIIRKLLYIYKIAKGNKNNKK